ncbi:MAG: hypothetical protein ACT4QG_03680 [Sporichthyaceae bacterium]
MRRVATVGVLLVVASAAGAATAAASETQAPKNDLLGLNALVSGVTDTLTKTPEGEQQLLGGVTAALAGSQQGAAARSASADGGLDGTVEKLPLLGGLLGGLVDGLGLGSDEEPAAVAKPVAPAKPAPAKAGVLAESVKKPVAGPEMSPDGSTWTMPRNAGTVEPAGGPDRGFLDGGGAGTAVDVVRSLSSVLPETAAGKAGVGAAAVALIVLGGVAVAGAAGAAGAAGRRQLVGGAW